MAELLLALAAAEQRDAAHHFKQSIAILDHLNAASTTFNMEHHAKVARLRAMVRTPVFVPLRPDHGRWQAFPLSDHLIVRSTDP